MAELLMTLLGGAKIGAVYALAAIGLVVIHKATRTVNFAHGGLVMLGAFATYQIVVVYEWPYWTAYVLVPILIGALGAFLEISVLRPLRKADLFIVIVGTIFLGTLLSEAFRLAENSELLAVPAVFKGRPFLIEFGGSVVIVTREQLWVTLGALATGLAALVTFRYLPLGRSMRAMASNSRGAQLCGYSVEGVYVTTWFLGSALAGLAGAFAAPSKGVSPDLAVFIISSAFIAAVIGGFDSLGGALIGGILLGIIETLAAAYVSSTLGTAISFFILFCVLLVRPEGLFPEAKRRHV
ncbi:branched-chain amino acid ABC transporter permease [Rhodopseudomonas palustris]|uniref:Branched-chain amino acid ABC transporter permease n=1 Tax=Rhodopseudomonas palustris TaxID=1076 RepID=A0A418V0Z3_RHOPL|nr:branched-chain amino acid ABC transporter permease [Rhodopseudomonas palustris]RJF69500.1 branched-chain amino acid ABC transporter permease [Rhodopseudomonas palustris]